MNNSFEKYCNNNEFRFILEKGSKKYHCPDCLEKTFVKYINLETGNYLKDQYGRCDREIKCGYHFNPYTDKHGLIKNNPFIKSNKSFSYSRLTTRRYIPVDVLCKTLAGYKKNAFIQNLLQRVKYPFKIEDIEKVVSLYYLGTIQSGYRKGAITFPFIDKHNNVRTIQVKQFDKTNHTIGTDFLHSIIEKSCFSLNKPLPNWLKLYKENNTKVSCLFGEHLLNKYPNNPIALVEAPKTAIYGALYFGFPEQPKNFLWLAVYNLSSLNFDKCQVLEGRKVYLFPDLSKDGKAFELWSSRAKDIQRRLKNSFFKVSNLLERLAPKIDKDKGKDLADYLINIDWRLFR